MSTIKRILVATDFSRLGNDAVQRASLLTAVDLGPRSTAVLRATLTVTTKAHITACHACQAPFEAKLRYKGFSEEDIARYSAPETRAAARALLRLISINPNPKPKKAENAPDIPDPHQ